MSLNRTSKRCIPYPHIETLCFEVWIFLRMKKTNIKKMCVLRPIGILHFQWPMGPKYTHFQCVYLNVIQSSFLFLPFHSILLIATTPMVWPKTTLLFIIIIYCKEVFTISSHNHGNLIKLEYRCVFMDLEFQTKKYISVEVGTRELNG